MAYDWWLAPVVYSGLSLVLLEARLHRAASRGGKLVYPGSTSLKLLFGGGAVGLSVFLYQYRSTAEWWEMLPLVALVIGCLALWPKTILTGRHGIECRWWWRPRVSIPWDEVSFAEEGSAGAIKVVGEHARITFEGYNADPDCFKRELTTRSKVKKISNPKELANLQL